MENRISTINEVIYKPITGEWGDTPTGENDIKVIRTTNFTNSGQLNLTKGVVERSIKPSKVEQKKLKYGDIIIEKSGGSPKQPVGRVVFFDLEEDTYLCNNFTAILRAKESIHSKYLFYFLFNLHKAKVTLTFQNKTTGIINLKLNRLIEKVKIPLPPLPIQGRIAAILDQADALRRKDQELLERYDALAQSVFLDMFGDPVRNEKGWEIKQLQELSTKILSGTTPRGGRTVYVEKGILFLRSQNVWRNRLELDDVAFIDKKTHAKMSKSSLKNGDILMTKTGRVNTENSSLGRAAIYTGEDDQANLNGHVYLIRLKNYVLNQFVLFILATREYRDYIRRVCVGGIDKRQINKSHLEEFPIIFPPVDSQEKFVSFIQNIEQQKQLVLEQQKKSEALFQSLLQKAFKGELVKSESVG